MKGLENHQLNPYIPGKWPVKWFVFDTFAEMLN